MTTDYGRDVYCDSSRRTGRYASGLLLIAQNALHRLDTPRGLLQGGEEEQDYGLDLPGRIGSITTAAEAAALPGEIRNELRKDVRIRAVRATVVESDDGGGAVSWTVAIECDTEQGTFALAASAVTVEIVGFPTGVVA